MKNRHGANPNIQTSAHAILKEAATAALETAQLAIARGPAGIGKSFGLTMLQKSMSQKRDKVFLFTATAHNGRSVKRFFEELVLKLAIMGDGRNSAMHRLEWELMKSLPFCSGCQRILLIIDECQHLDAKLIECLRGLFDIGSYARDFDPTCP
jgi:thymidine kinase